MADLTGMRVLIKQVPTPTGAKSLYPNFNRISAQVRRNMDWSAYIDSFGSGWHYDQVAPFGRTDLESPNADEMFGIIGVPDDFAQAAKAMFPSEVILVNEPEFTRLWETRTKSTAADTIIDTDRLDQLRSRYGIVGPIDDPSAVALMTPEDRRAVDPTDEAPGIVNNATKTMARYKEKTGHTINVIVAGAPRPLPRPRRVATAAEDNLVSGGSTAPRPPRPLRRFR